MQTKEYKRSWYLANKELTIERSRLWHNRNPERVKELAKRRREADPEKYRAYFRKHRLDNAEKIREYMRKWKAANPGKVNANTAKRHTAKIQRTPNWLSKEQLDQINEYYIEAARLSKLTGVLFHVDHIVPLKGKLVSGLHVPWNLQVLPYYDNASKGNKYDGTK